MYAPGTLLTGGLRGAWVRAPRVARTVGTSALVAVTILLVLAAFAPLPALAAATAIALLITIVWRPGVALVILFALVPFNLALFAVLVGRLGISTGPLSNWKDALLAAVVLRALLEAVRQRGLGLPRPAMDRFLIGYVLASCVLASISPNAVPAAYGLARLVEGPLLFLAIVALRPSRQTIMACLYAMVAAATILSIAALIERGPHENFITWYGAPRPTFDSSFYTGANGTGYRSGSFLYSPLLLAFYLAGVIPLTIALAVAKRRWRRLALIAAVAVAVAAMIFTFTRSGYIGLAIAAMVVMAMTIRHRLVRVALVCTVGIASMSVLLTVATGVNSTLTRSGENIGHIGSPLDDLALIAQQPLGYGLGSKDAVSYRFGLTEISHASENNYLARGVEGGIAGLLLYLVLLYVLLIRLRREWSAARRRGDERSATLLAGALGALLGIGTAGLFLGIQELLTEEVIWGSAALAIVLSRINLEERDAATTHVQPFQAPRPVTSS
jgi:hypothetical protein